MRVMPRRLGVPDVPGEICAERRGAAGPGEVCDVDSEFHCSTLAAECAAPPVVTVHGPRIHSNRAASGRNLDGKHARPHARLTEVIVVKNSVRWLPAVIAPVLVVAGVFAIPAVASAAGTPPSKSAQQVLALIAGAKDISYSGTIHQSSDLGLPQLPSVGPGSSSSGTDSTSQILDLLTADHTARLFVDGSSKERVQVLDSLAERDVIRNGTDVWTYDSKTRSSTHLTLTARDAKSAAPTAETLSPAQLADKFIAAIEPTTDVAVTSTSEVAGRPVYELDTDPEVDVHPRRERDPLRRRPDRPPTEGRRRRPGAEGGRVQRRFQVDRLLEALRLAFHLHAAHWRAADNAQEAGCGSNDPDKAAAKPTVIGSGWDAIVALPAGAAGATTKPGERVDSRAIRPPRRADDIRHRRSRPADLAAVRAAAE